MSSMAAFNLSLNAVDLVGHQRYLGNIYNDYKYKISFLSMNQYRPVLNKWEIFQQVWTISATLLLHLLLSQKTYSGLDLWHLQPTQTLFTLYLIEFHWQQSILFLHVNGFLTVLHEIWKNKKKKPEIEIGIRFFWFSFA